MLKKPFLGAAYYPEDWPEEEIPKDIERMKEAGITCVRIGEFAWLKMEPEPGKYEFGWLHKVIDCLAAEGISVILGTPTATPPVWLLEEHPDAAVMGENGIRTSHGGRRHCCSNNPHYREAARRIVGKMGQEFGDDPNVAAWQLDNEIYAWGKGCFCGYCAERYHKRLQARYGTVQELNRRWDLNTWSQGYSSFEQVPADGNGWHNPHLGFEWIMSQQDAHMEFLHEQAAILKKYTKAPVGTDMMPVGGLDYEKTNEPLDVIMFNHYNTAENLNDAVFWFDMLRTVKEAPFINTETQTSWNGTTEYFQNLKPEGFCRMNSWLPVALGGEGNMYWLWRQHWGGHELMHGAVLSPQGRPFHVFGEIRQTAGEFCLASDYVTTSRVDTQVAMHSTAVNWNLHLQHGMYAGFSYIEELYRAHRAIAGAGLRPDVIGAGHALESYRLIFTPFALTLEEEGLGERMREWVAAGGTWVCGPMTDIRDDAGAFYRDRGYGILEEMLDIRLDFTIPTDGSVMRTAWADGREASAEHWAECVSGAGEALITVTGGYSSLTGESVVRRIPYGRGTVYLCGTLLSGEGMQRLVEMAADTAGVTRFETEGSLQVIPRITEDRKHFLFLAETGNAPAGIRLPGAMRDMLTGREYPAGWMEAEPYRLCLLEYMEEV